MGQESDPETQGASSSVLTLDSLFNIQGPVRLVPQLASQKPHILLRRECVSKNDDESSCLPTTTRFSLVANKRFTISKGHNLTLGIADPSSEHESKLLGPERSFLLEFDISNQLHMVDNLSSLPARMRKSMTGKKTYDAFAESQRPNSLGFPGYPLSIPQTRVFASASVQTDPIEATPSSSRTPPPATLKTDKQQAPLRLYPSPVSADGHSLKDALVDHDSDMDARTERSFSSMDLSTPSQSRSNSPVISATPLPGNDSTLVPGATDANSFPMPTVIPEASTVAREDSDMCGVTPCTPAGKHDEPMPSRTEPKSCSIVPVHANTSQLRPNGILQPSTNGSSTSLPGVSRRTPAPRMSRATSQQTATNLFLTPTPQPTISNPLGIRPSANAFLSRLPKGPRSLSGSTTTHTCVQPTKSTTSALAPTGLVSPKKPIVVGAKWTALRWLPSSSSQASAASSKAPAPAATVTTTTSAAKATTPLFRYSASPPHGEPASSVSSTGKRKFNAENHVANGQGNMFSRILYKANGGGDNMGEMKEQNQGEGQSRRNAEEQPRKKARIENVKDESLSPACTGLLQKTSSPAPLIVHLENTSSNGGDSPVDGLVPKSKQQRKRERRKLRKIQAELEMRAQTSAAQEEEKEKVEKAAELAQEADHQVLVAATPGPVQKTPRIVHPLPVKPQITTKQGDSSGNQTKASAFHAGVAQGKVEEHTAKEARGPGTAPVPAYPQAAVGNGNVMWPSTSPSREFQLLGWKGDRIAVQHLAFSSDGKRLVIAGSEMAVRLWETTPQPKEIVRWVVDTPVVAICWLQYDAGVLVLCSDGSADIWTPEMTKWQRKTLFSVPLSVQSEKPLSIAYAKDRIAISTTVSVKVWLLTSKGVWQPQREIRRTGVTALRFQTDGSGLFGGCRDGTVWYCEVPNGTLRAYAFLRNKCITSIDLHPNGTQLLVGQKGGSAYLISHQANENNGTVEKKYVKSDGESEGTYTAIFARRGQAVVSGSSNGCALVWDRKKGNMVYGLKHGIDDAILAIAAFDGRPGVNGMMVSGTREGKLCWWPMPEAAIR